MTYTPDARDAIASENLSDSLKTVCAVNFENFFSNVLKAPEKRDCVESLSLELKEDGISKITMLNFNPVKFIPYSNDVI